MDVETVGGHHTRSYQQEMFERSMRGNTIVVMDTGSGKTHVAILRIQAELDRCSPDKRVWFVAPTVALCQQQHHELSAALPAYQHRLLLGSDNVRHWSEKRIWDAALDKHRVVVSTPEVLADALRHDFVNISNLALIVFDEAHNCIKKNPANRIMQDAYYVHKAERGQASVPHILGLSASLIMKSDIKTMGTLERNLDSIGVTPRIYRQDLLRYVHRPECRMLMFDPSNDLYRRTACRSLYQLSYVKSQLAILLSSRDSIASIDVKAVQETVNSFHRTAEAMLEDLGSWAADYFINQTIDALQHASSDFQDLFEVRGLTRSTLLDVFHTHGIQSLCQDNLEPSDDTVSSKVKCLISFLFESSVDDLAGIVFVTRRATTSVLAALLERHPVTKYRLRCRPFVGTSNAPGRRFGLHELVDLRLQRETLSGFRAGEHNLIIATNALEEGIDVQSCNVVACFDFPPNVKSFIQRRGRARHIQSRLAILLSAQDDQTKIDKWQAIEEELALLCQSDRQQALQSAADELPDETMRYELRASSTGAKLTADDTVAHLNHFCDKLPYQEYGVLRPEYSYQQDYISGLITATVTLPNSVSVNVRQAASLKAWKTERAAKKDAAFQAYAAIYRAGLLNENLLPLSHDWSVDSGEDEDSQTLASRTDIPPQIHVWSEMAAGQQQGPWYETAISIVPPDVLGEQIETVRLITPQPIVKLPQLLLEWSSKETFKLNFGPSTPIGTLDAPTVKLLQESTRILYTAVRSERIPCVRRDFTTLFAPSLQYSHLQSWVQQHGRQMSMDDITSISQPTLVRVPYLYRPVLAFQGWLKENNTLVVQCESHYKRRDFTLTAIPETDAAADDVQPIDNKPTRLETFAANLCTFSTLPHSFARLGLFMPAILHHAEDFTITARLQSTLLQDVSFNQHEHILTALAAPSAKRRLNYERLEFFGDSVLKYVVSAHLYATQRYWHEGYLSMKRAQLVSNMSLARAASRLNLAQFIITESMPYKGWTIPLLSSPQTTRKDRKISHKVLADVVEALIGAAWVDSGLPAAMQCINLFVPAIPLSLPNPLPNPPVTIYTGFGAIDDIQSLIGHTFRQPALLLEALTHPSCGGHTGTESYQRLEFLGDAVLDMLVAQRLSTASPPLTPGRMTDIKSALVNARLLGFFCQDLRSTQTRRAVETNPTTQTTTETTATHEVYFTAFLRTAVIPEMRTALLASQLRFAAQREDIHAALAHGKIYPWTQLLTLRPEKLYSDMVESVLGAVYVDSGGDLAACEPFVERLGLWAYADRLVGGEKGVEVDLSHPRARLKRAVGGREVKFRVWLEALGYMYACEVKVDRRVVAGAEGCWDSDAAVAVAASRALEVLGLA